MQCQAPESAPSSHSLSGPDRLRVLVNNQEGLYGTKLSPVPVDQVDVSGRPARLVVSTIEPLAYCLEDAGKVLGGVSVPTLHRWVKAGRLRTTKVGGRTLVRRAELERLLLAGEEARAA